MPRQWTGLSAGQLCAMTRALPCTEEGSAVPLTPMRYQAIPGPHNPRVYSIDYERKMAVHKVPFGLYHLQDLGRTRRVMEGEGEFVGADAYSQFGQLANVFYDSGPGLLVHPLWQTASAYFVALRLEQEPRPDYVRYSLHLLGGCELLQWGGADLRARSGRPPPVVPVWAAATIW